MSQSGAATLAKPPNPVMQVRSSGCREVLQGLETLPAAPWPGSSLFPITSWWGKDQVREVLCLLTPSPLLLLGNWLLTSTASHSRQVFCCILGNRQKPAVSSCCLKGLECRQC